MVTAQCLETGVIDDTRVGCAQCNGAGAASLLPVEQRELSERGSGAEHGEGGDVAERSADADRDAAAFDEKDRVAAVAFVEDDFTGCEPAALGRREEPT